MKLYQITEDDLADLEKLVPQLADVLMDRLDNTLRVKIRRLQKILSDVRWNYGPPTDVQIIDEEGQA